MIDNSKVQMSESIIVGIPMVLSGGFMDAYTYLFRGEVFANAQTGNMLLFGIHLSKQEWIEVFRYGVPVAAFAAGVFLAQMIRLHTKKIKRMHWRQYAVLMEILIMVVVSFMGNQMDLAANTMISFACGIQVQAFRKIQGNNLATTMCIGNLRTGTDLLCTYLHERDVKILCRSLLYYGVILTFMAGAVLGYLGVCLWKEKAILVSAVLLTAGFLIMMREEME